MAGKSISSNNKVMNAFPTQGIVCQQKIGFPYFLNFLRYLLCKEKLVQETRTESDFDVYNCNIHTNIIINGYNNIYLHNLLITCLQFLFTTKQLLKSL